MPGEQLVCVWQAAFALNQEDKVLRREILKKITAGFASLPSTHYSENKFDETLKADPITFDNYKTYVLDELRDAGVPLGVLLDDIETACWGLSKESYKSELKSDDVLLLWQIANRLTEEGTYPPVVCRDECLWLCEKIASELNKHWKMLQCHFEISGSSFQELLDVLDKVFFHGTPQRSVRACVVHIHEWLVQGVMKSGWIYRRSKHNDCSGWTGWYKVWLVLKPDRLEHYEKAPPVESKENCKKGQIVLDKSVSIETVPDFRSVFKNLSGCFMIANDAAIHEFGETDGEGPDWFSCLEELMDCNRMETTPIAKLLKDRQRRRQEESTTALTRPVSASAIEMTIDAVVQNGHVPPSAPQGGPPPQSRTGWQFAKKTENRDEILKQGEDKMKAVFMKVDTNGNGWIDKEEFTAYLRSLGLNMTEKEINLVYNSIDKNQDGRLSFEEFEKYFMKNVLDEEETNDRSVALRAAFVAADRDGSGTINFKEFTEYYWDKKRDARVAKLMGAFSRLNKQGGEAITFADFQNLYSGTETPPPPGGEGAQKVDVVEMMEDRLKEEYDDSAVDELDKYIRERWDKFAGFRRLGASGEAVMTGTEGMVADFVPGEYSLKDIAMFSDLPPIVPKHTIIKGVTWESSGVPGKSGKAVFPDDFDGVIATDLATNEHLRYYGCSLADAQQVKISLLYRHGIQDFTYSNQYLEDYVTSTNQGAGIEKHDFAHLDCPLDDATGVFVIGKFVGDDELHVTAFQVPIRHTVYSPAGTVHSNDYLKGTWRTMLSDEAEIDHVHLTKKSPGNGDDVKHFTFQFA